MKNIELKVLLENFAYVNKRLKKIGAKPKGKLKQVDTYYNANHGRLKLREINGRRFEMIFYDRPNIGISKVSEYQVVDVHKDQLEYVKYIMKNAHGIKVVVKKERNFWMYQHTRVHLDKVEGLGNFLELETIVDGIDMPVAKKEHALVIKLLDLAKKKKLSKSYSDMIKKK